MFIAFIYVIFLVSSVVEFQTWWNKKFTKWVSGKFLIFTWFLSREKFKKTNIKSDVVTGESFFKLSWRVGKNHIIDNSQHLGLQIYNMINAVTSKWWDIWVRLYVYIYIHNKTVTMHLIGWEYPPTPPQTLQFYYSLPPDQSSRAFISKENISYVSTLYIII